VSVLFQYLDIASILKIWSGVLLGNNIIIYSKNLNNFNSIVKALNFLVFPLSLDRYSIGVSDDL